MEEYHIKPDHFNPKILYCFTLSFDGESPTPSHQHDFISLIYILSGSCRYKIGQEHYQVKPGDLIICNAGVYHHRLLAPEEQVEELHIGFCNLKLQGFPKEQIISEHDSPILEFVKYGQSFHNCCEEILHEQEKNDAGKPLLLKSLTMKLIVLILKEKYFSTVLEKSNGIIIKQYDKQSIVNTIVDYITENYMKPISLTKIAENIYLSPVYTSKIFKEVMGDSPINYLIKYRLKKACELFEEETAIKIVAKKVGYEDAYYFSKVFKKHLGLSPSKYLVAKKKTLL